MVTDLANDMKAYAGYAAKKKQHGNDTKYFLEGFIVLPNRMRIWDVAGLLPGFMFRYFEDFHEIERHFMKVDATFINVNTLSSIAEDLQELFDGEQSG